MSGKRLGFSDYKLTTAKKKTKRGKFLFGMDMVIPWQMLIDLIAPHCPKISKKTAGFLMRWLPCCGFTFCSSIILATQVLKGLIEVPTMRSVANIEIYSIISPMRRRS